MRLSCAFSWGFRQEKDKVWPEFIFAVCQCKCDWRLGYTYWWALLSQKMSSRDKVVYCAQFDSLSGKICFANILGDWRYKDPSKFSNLTVKLASPHLVLHLFSYFFWGGTSRALWNQLWAVHLLILTVVYSSSFWCPHSPSVWLPHCFCWHQVWPPASQRRLPMAFPEQLGCWWDLSKSGCFFLLLL